MEDEPLKETPAISLLFAKAVAVSDRVAVAGLKASPLTKYPLETLTFPIDVFVVVIFVIIVVIVIIETGTLMTKPSYAQL